MAVKILIKRHLPKGDVTRVTDLLKRLRSFTLAQPGYVYGETLSRLDDPGEYMVISTWRSAEDWNNWMRNPQRIAVQEEIDLLLGEKTEYAMYENVV